MRIDIGKYDRIGFFVIDFGNGFSIDAPFDAGIEDDGHIPTFEWFANGAPCSLALIGVDPCKGNRIFGRCDVALSPLVSDHLKNQIKIQMRTRVSPDFSFSVVNKMYEQYQHTAAMKSILSTNGEIAMNQNRNDFASAGNNIRNVDPDSMSPKDVILRHFADMPHILSTATYPIELPQALAPWHCHTDDGGHSILCLPSTMIEENKSERHLILPFDMDEGRTEYNVESILLGDNLDIERWLMPFTVKGVLRGYRVERVYCLQR